MAKGGFRANSGRPAIWDTEKIKMEVSRLSGVWWSELEKMMQSKNPGAKKFAMSEFNKLQVKAMPQAITGEGGGPVQINLVQYGNNRAVQLHTEDVPASTPGSA